MLFFTLLCAVGEGDLRLVDPASNRSPQGRLEIFLQGEWGTVCSSGFGIREADVACRQLGYVSAIRVGRVDIFG